VQVVNVMMGDLSDAQIKDVQAFSLNAYQALAAYQLPASDHST
jgi:hypothetical protein